MIYSVANVVGESISSVSMTNIANQLGKHGFSYKHQNIVNQ